MMTNSDDGSFADNQVVGSKQPFQASTKVLVTSGNEKETNRSLPERSASTNEIKTKDSNSKTTTLNPNKATKTKTKRNASLSSKLEDQMNFEHLKKLEAIFQEADADNGGGLDMDEFREAMRKTMGSEIDVKELEMLFMKVDTNCDGAVDWDEYLSYMLLEYQEKDSMTSLVKEEPFPVPLQVLPSNHRDNIVRIEFFQNLSNRHTSTESPGGRYMSLSKEGQLAYYGLDFDLQKSVTIGPAKETCVAIWLTDLAPCPNVNMVAISSTDREISFYDVSANRFERRFQLIGFRDPILTMCFSFDRENLNNCTLIGGDSNGCVTAFRFVEAMKRGLFGAYPPKGVVKRIPVFQVMTHMIPGVYCLIFNKLHSNWINCARYFQLAKGLECFISCCSTDEDSMFLGDLTHVTYKPKWPGFGRLRSNRSCYYKVKKGILALDYSKEWNLIVTGSFDCIVRTWNPYSAKPASVIKGHLTPVQHITVIPGSGQVITCGKDKTVRVIDLRDHTTIQIIRPRLFASLGPLSHAFNTIFYDKRCKCMLLGTTQVGVLRGFDGKKKIDLLDVKSHTGAVSTVLYNKLFNQVVTAGHDSVLSVWDLNTGSKTIQFHTIKGVELTCMCFDQTDRRLITGSRNGAVKIWNFNNGACLRTLSPGNGLEVTGVVCLKQKIITAGWNKKLTVYIDSQDQDTEDDVKEWAEVHHDDILCLASFRHNNGVATIASSSYDGNIFIWSLDSGHVLCRLNKMISYSPLSYKGSKAAKRDKPDYSKLKRTHTLTRLEKSLSMINNKLKLPQISSKLRVEKSTEFSDKVSTLKLPPIFPKQGYGDQNKDRWKEPIATSSRASIRLSSPKANSVSTIMPSAGGEDTCNFDKTNHAQHQLDVLLGKQNRDYWEAEVAIDKLLFLQSRPHSPHTATLVSSGAQGWVHSWSVHPQGGLLGQFMAAQNDGESVVSMATDDENSILISGDSTGYVKVWDIDTYCYKKPRQHPKRKSLVNDIFNTQLHSALMDEEAANLLSARRMVRLNTVPPDLNHYFRAHVGSVNDITYVNEKQLFLTAGSEGTVRLWTVSGSYVGTFGQQFSWSLSNPSTVRIPTDIKRVASSNTFKAFKTGESPWRLAKNLKHFVALRDLGRGKMKSLGPSVVEAKKEELEKVNKTYLKNMKHEDNVERDYEKTVKAMEKSEVLGNWYKPKQRHRMLPKIDIKTHFGNFLIHSSIPFSSLEKMEEIEVPEILKNKWKLQKEMSQLENEAAKARNLRSSIAGVRVKNRILGSFNAKKKSQNRASFSQVAKTVANRFNQSQPEQQK